MSFGEIGLDDHLNDLQKKDDLYEKQLETIANLADDCASNVIKELKSQYENMDYINHTQLSTMIENAIRDRVFHSFSKKK